MESPGENANADSEMLVQTAVLPMASAALVVLCLAVDELNPVKILCSYLPTLVTQWRVACIALVFLLVLTIAQREFLIYLAVRTFFRCTINNMFFRSVEVVGAENLPIDGPIILTGNHNNQFVDGIVLLTNCKRRISFMIAQKSFDRPLIGFLARTFQCIPVQRPQDIAAKGDGKVVASDSNLLRGVGTKFTSQVESGGQLVLSGCEKPFKVKEVLSDTELEVDREVGRSLSSEGGCDYKILPKLDQSSMYDNVFTSLQKGRCLGIFPEGGSHDRTDLLPLKAGVAIIALEAYSRLHISVPIVPVGLNYFSGHRFGGRVVVEFGAPIKVPDTLYTMAESDRRGATDALLQLIATGMRSVIVPTPDYYFLQQVYMVRKLYVSDGVKLSPEKVMDLNRRFAVGTRRIMHLITRGDSADSVDSPASTPSRAALKKSESKGGFEEELTLKYSSREWPEDRAGSKSGEAVAADFQPDDLQCIEQGVKELAEYMASLKRLGLRDHHVRQIGWWSMSDFIGRLLYLLVLMLLGGIPQLVLNLPVMFLASKLAAKEQKKSLKASSVKLKGLDVVMSYKIIYVLIFIPVLFLFYFIFVWFFLDLTITSIVLVFMSLPFFAFLGMKASEQGVRAYTDVVALFKRLLPETRREQDALPAKRAYLQKRVKQIVRMFGPKLGDLYWQKEVDWNKEMGGPYGGGWSPSTSSTCSQYSTQTEQREQEVRRRVAT